MRAAVGRWGGKAILLAAWTLLACRPDDSGIGVTGTGGDQGTTDGGGDAVAGTGGTGQDGTGGTRGTGGTGSRTIDARMAEVPAEMEVRLDAQMNAEMDAAASPDSRSALDALPRSGDAASPADD